MLAGGGVIYSEASAELTVLAESLGIPVAETFAGKGAIERDAWWGVGGIGVEGNPAANALAREADLVLCVGTRLTDFTTASRSLFSPGVQFLSINVCDKDARKEGAIRLVADAKLAFGRVGTTGRARRAQAEPDVARPLRGGDVSMASHAVQRIASARGGLVDSRSAHWGPPSTGGSG